MSQSVPIRDASTVLLVRDGQQGIEVFLQHRVQQMAFAGGMTVFPGGGVDPSDRTAQVAWAGPEPRWWAERLSADEDAARALVLAAVRETFEECGVLLAGTADAVHPDPSEFAAERAALVNKELTFGDFLTRRELVLRADLLAPFSHWITPENESRRYDTRFFVAVMPDGQEADGQTTEASGTEWNTAGEALDNWRSGRRFLLPPTWSQLRDIGRFATVAQLLADEREIRPVMPRVSDSADGSGLASLRFDDSAEYLAALGDGRLDRLRNA